MAKLKYYPRTPLVTEPLETELFRYNLDDPLSIDYTDEEVMLDIETHSKKMADIRLVQIYQASWDKAIIFDTNKYPLDEIYQVIKDQHLIIHTATFEMSCFQSDLGLRVAPFTNWSDTFLLSRIALADEVQAFSLDVVAEAVHGRNYYTEYAQTLGYTASEAAAFKKALQRSFLDSPKSNKRALPLTYEQLYYAALDVLVMPKIYRSLKHVENQFIIQLDYKVIPFMQKYQWYGLPVDKSEWRLAWDKAQNKIEEASQVLPEELNVNSWVQVRKLFNSTASDDTFMAEQENEAKRNPEDIEKAERAKWAHAIRQKRKYIKQQAFLTTYVKSDRVKGFFSPRTISGRLAAEADNVLQIPRELKHIFGYEDKNKYLIHCDYAALEFRMLCAVLGEEIIESLLRDGVDIHKYAASGIYDKPMNEITKWERFVGKTANFGLAYGAGGKRFADMAMKNAGLYIPEDESKKIVKAWKKLYPGVKEWHDRNGRSKDNKDITLNGRPYWANLYTDLNAIKIQGTSAEVFKLANLYTYWYDQTVETVKMLNTIHDSQIEEADTLEDARRKGLRMYKCMLVGWFEGIKNSKIPDLPMPLDVNIVQNWADADVDLGEQKGFREDLTFSGSYEEYLSFKDEVLSWKFA